MSSVPTLPIERLRESLAQSYTIDRELGRGGMLRCSAVGGVEPGQARHRQLRLQRRAGDYGDMIAMGILDPTKVTRTALQNAASIAGLMITTEAMVAEAPKKDEPAGGGHGGGGMGGMDF